MCARAIVEQPRRDKGVLGKLGRPHSKEAPLARFLKAQRQQVMLLGPARVDVT